MKWWRIVFVDPKGSHHVGPPTFDSRVAQMVLSFSRKTCLYPLKGGFFVLVEEENGHSRICEAYPRDDYGVDHMVDWIATVNIPEIAA